MLSILIWVRGFFFFFSSSRSGIYLGHVRQSYALVLVPFNDILFCLKAKSFWVLLFYMLFHFLVCFRVSGVGFLGNRLCSCSLISIFGFLFLRNIYLVRPWDFLSMASSGLLLVYPLCWQWSYEVKYLEKLSKGTLVNHLMWVIQGTRQFLGSTFLQKKKKNMDDL